MLLLPIPLFILYRKTFQKKRSKAIELKRAFNHLSRKHKLSIDEVEIFSGKVMGLDKKQGKLLLVEDVNSSSGEKATRQLICLKSFPTPDYLDEVHLR